MDGQTRRAKRVITTGYVWGRPHGSSIVNILSLYRYETAGVVSVTRSMDIAVAYIIQITWFGDIPLWTSILGAFVVVMAVFAMAMEDAVLTLMKQTFGTTGWC